MILVFRFDNQIKWNDDDEGDDCDDDKCVILERNKSVVITEISTNVVDAVGAVAVVHFFPGFFFFFSAG